MRNKKYLAFILTLALCAAFSVPAFSEAELSLDEAVSRALENNILLRRAKIGLSSSERNSKHSWNQILPSVGVSATDEKNLSGENRENTFAIEGKASVSIAADYFSSIKLAWLDYEAAKISYDESVYEIKKNVKDAYFALVYERENLAFKKENLANAKSQYEQNQEKYRRGTLSELESLSSKVSWERLKPEINALELSYKNDLKQFAILIGMEESEITSLVLKGTLEDFLADYEGSFSSEAADSLAKKVQDGDIPSVKNLKAQIEAGKAGVRKARCAAYGPTATAAYTISPYSHTTGFSGEESTDSKVKQSVSLGISIPLENYLPFSQGADSIENAKDAVSELLLALKEKSLSSKANLDSILEGLEQKNGSISSIKEYVVLAEKTYGSARTAYAKGTMDLLSMQNAVKENLEAKLLLQNELLETLKLYTSLEQLCGTEIRTK